MATKWQRTVIPISKKLSLDEAEALALDVVESIRQRTESENLGVRFGKEGLVNSYVSFPKYSKEYIASLDFKNSGKSASSVDLTLSGEMLAALDVLKVQKGKITIGFEKGSDENAKADGNIRGTYGTNKPDKKKARNFLGISKADLRALEREYL